MNTVADQYRGADLIAVAKNWGYQSRIGVVEPAQEGRDDAVLLHGSMTATELSCGLRMCVSDLTAKRAHERNGVLVRTLAITFPIAGEGYAYGLSGQRAVALSPGMCVPIKASDSVALTSAFRCEQRTCGLFLDACPERISDSDLAARIARSIRCTAISSLGVDGAMSACLHRIHMANDTGVVGRLRLEACALDLLASILEQEDCVSPDRARLASRDTGSVGRVRDYLIEYPEHSHSLSELASVAGISPSGLKRKFKIVMGQSVFDFLRDVRLERARCGLEREGWTLKQATWFAGYRHPTNFGVAYRRKFGVTPGKV